MPKIESSMKVGDIVNLVPQTADLFKQYKIDFCCGGNRPLAEVMQESNLDEHQLLEQLNGVYQQFQERESGNRNWNGASFREIIEHIVYNHHAFLNEELPELSPYVTKVLRVHGRKHPHLAEVHRLFHELKTDLEQHLITEEQADFPMILDYAKNPSPDKLEKLKAHIQSLTEEHETAGTILKKLREATDDYTLPPGACRTYTLVYRRLEALEQDLFQHIHLENNVLFPKVLQEA